MFLNIFGFEISRHVFSSCFFFWKKIKKKNGIEIEKKKLPAVLICTGSRFLIKIRKNSFTARGELRYNFIFPFLFFFF